MCLLVNDVLSVVGDVLAVLDVLDWCYGVNMLEGRLPRDRRVPCLAGTADVGGRFVRTWTVI